MVRRVDPNPFEEEEVNPFSDPIVRTQIPGQSHYSAGPFYTASTGVASATNSKLSPLAPEPSDFTYDQDVTIDIPLGTTKDTKKREKELEPWEVELKRKSQPKPRDASSSESKTEVTVAEEKKRWGDVEFDDEKKDDKVSKEVDISSLKISEEGALDRAKPVFKSEGPVHAVDSFGSTNKTVDTAGNPSSSNPSNRSSNRATVSSTYSCLIF